MPVPSIRKIVFCLLCALSLSVVAGKDLHAAGADEYPSKPITVIISWAAGSVGDNGARILLPFVAEALGGANFTVINKPGASGWLGWDEVAAAKPDGYTISLLTLPSFYGGYMDPQYNRKSNLSTFDMIANQVSDWAILYGQGGEKRWKDMKGMLDYAKSNELVVGASGVGSDDNMVLQRLKRQQPSAKLTPLQGTSSGAVLPMLLGKHIDMQMGNLGDAAPQVKSGELTALCVFAPERSPILPDVPTYKELGLGDLIGSSDRGFLMPKGVDPAIRAKLEKAFETGIKNPKHVEKLLSLGINVNYMNAADLTTYAKQGEEVVTSLLDILGWKK